MSWERSFKSLENRIARQLQSLPTLIGNQMVNFALDNFRMQGYQDHKFEPWKTRKGDKSKKPRALLIKTGRLRRGIKFRVTSSSVTLFNDVPYAAVHNFGGAINRAERSETFIRNRHAKTRGGKNPVRKGQFKRGTTAGEGFSFKSYSYNMPKRQFIGRSPVLLTQLRNTTITHVNKAFK